MSKRPADHAKANQEILIEFVAEGSSVKVTAIDAATGVEASIVGPSSAPRATLEQAATRKLAYLMRKSKGAN